MFHRLPIIITGGILFGLVWAAYTHLSARLSGRLLHFWLRGISAGMDRVHDWGRTTDGIGVIIEDIKKAGIQTMRMAGGGHISPSFAKSIGADGYAKDAAETVKVAKSLFQPSPQSL